MNNESSICVDINVKNEILKASRNLNISASSLAKSLIKKACQINNSIIISGQLTEYQKSTKDSEIVTLRYRLSDEEHKFFFSNRVRLETSISMLLLIGFLLFFKKIISKLSKKNEINWNNYTVIYINHITRIENFLKKVEFNGIKGIKLE